LSGHLCAVRCDRRRSARPFGALAAAPGSVGSQALQIVPGQLACGPGRLELVVNLCALDTRARVGGQKVLSRDLSPHTIRVGQRGLVTELRLSVYCGGTVTEFAVTRW
jgi:hypothetical protein